MKMQTGCGTHFDSVPIEDDKLSLLCPRMALARLDCQKSTPDQILAQIDQVRGVQPYPMEPLIILNSLDNLEVADSSVPIEWHNERDINLGDPPENGTYRMDPSEYRKTALEAYAITKRTGRTLVLGAIANPLYSDRWDKFMGRSRGLSWLEEMDFKSFPEDIVFSMHRYERYNTYENGHPPFESRDAEFAAVRKTVGAGRRIWVTEGPGYEVMQGADLARTAGEIRKELEHYDSKGVERYYYYQIKDSTIDGHDFGLFDEQGQLKQTIFEAFPLREDQENTIMLDIHEALSRKEAIPHPEKPGKFTSPHPDGDGSVLAVVPSTPPSIDKRPKGEHTAYCTWYDDGRTAVFDEVFPSRKYAILLVD